MIYATSTKELADILVTAINDEPYFTKDVLIPKVRAIITGFRLSLSTANYSKTYDAKGTERLIRSNELHNLEKEFWKQRLRALVGEEKMQGYYQWLDQERKEWDNSTTNKTNQP